jgi:Arc/MetJ-type ribon-helix-helix transcriptional regulator
MTAACIPIRYGSGATAQITVELTDDLLEFIDQQVASGVAASPAAVVARALRRDRQHTLAEQDARIYAAAAGDEDELDGLAAWASRQPLDLD